MYVAAVCKNNSNESVVTLIVPDDLLVKFQATVQALSMQYASQPDSAEVPDPPAESEADYSGVIATIMKAASIGDRMSAGKVKRIKEVLGEERANAIFGPNYGTGAWALFTPADPMRLRQKPGGVGWYQENNPYHNPKLLAQLLEVPGENPNSLVEMQHKQQSGDDPGNPFSQNGDVSPEDLYERIIHLSTQGRPLSVKQAAMVNKIIPGASTRIFAGGKDGAMQTFLKYYSENTKTEQGDWQKNPSFNYRAREYALRLAGGG